MTARDDILSAIRERRTRVAPRPPAFRPPDMPDDLVARFMERARASAAEVKLLDNPRDIAAAVAEALRSRNLPAVIHTPSDLALAEIVWSDAPGLTITSKPPGPNDAAIASVPLAIAETGTLAYPASAHRPASWHFRAGLEIAIVPRAAIVSDLERVLARLRSDLPSTLNLVTGPSRTGDIEQTLELGAHGPKALVVLVV
jgi:L-lactate dehydrogenase complex protein LldG